MLNQLAEKKKKTDELLKNILPEHVAFILKQFTRVEVGLHEQVCVMFYRFYQLHCRLLLYGYPGAGAGTQYLFYRD